MHRLEKIVKTFLDRQNKNGKPFLLALSGGPDSMALFHILYHEKIPFEVAHVNHKWRKESDLEENALADICKKQNVIFHLKRLKPETITGNLEDKCREERLHFFKEIVEKFGLKGVILGHHSDDQAETVLKRIFEGATLSKLKGLSDVSYHHGISYYRPFLGIRKKEIMDYLEEKKIPFFTDETNFDSKYLRSRLRKEIFPMISKEFGKEIVPSLSRLSQLSYELNDFLENYLKSFRDKVVNEGGHYYMDLSQEEIKTIFEWKVIIKDFLNRAGVIISHPTLENLLNHVQKGKGKKELIVGDFKLIIFNKTFSLSPKSHKSKI